MPRDGDSTSDSSSSSGGSSNSSLRRKRSSSESSTGSSWGSRSEGSDEETEAVDEDDAPSSPMSGWTILLLVLVLAAAVGLAVFLGNRGGEGSTTAGSAGSGKSGTSAEGGGEEDDEGTATQKTANGSPVQAATSVPSDFLESLAAKYSMSAAAVPSLTMPTAALPSPSAANSYIQETWKPVRGSSDYLTFETDPLDSASTEVVLQIRYEKGSYSGSGDVGGGIGNMQIAVFGEQKKRTMVSYEVGFNEGFDFVKGGKLPGSYGGDPGSGCTGGRNNPACFSLRMMWREDGAGELYAYIPIYDGLCDSEGTLCHGADGISFQRGAFTFEAGSYNTITEIAVMSSDTGTANGILAVYAGETLAFERNDLVLSANESVSFSTFIISSFFGGSTEDYASSAEAFTFYRNMRFFEGDDASSESGEKVEAASDG
ncbi:hypothetical protein JCM6882_008271 [Rhodosporidiobolus microsporus]